MSTEQGVEQIPALLRGQESIFAVVLGGAYDEAAYNTIRKATTGSDYQKVHWLRADMSQVPQGPPGPGYAQIVARRSKDKLEELKKGGKPQDEAVTY